ncbi:MAG: ABC transporter substrate-binding protein [Anaerolineae bacterium]
MHCPFFRWMRRIAGLIGLLVLIGLAAGCRAGQTATPAPTVSSTAPIPSPVISPASTHAPAVTPTPAPPLTVRYGEVQPLPQVWPWRDQDGDGIMSWWPLVWESLLGVDPTSGVLIPALADSWEVSADGLTVCFILRSDVRWHDGTPLRAEDVTAALRYFASPVSHSLWRAGLLNTAEVQQISSLVVEVRLSRRTAPCCIAWLRCRYCRPLSSPPGKRVRRRRIFPAPAR